MTSSQRTDIAHGVKNGEFNIAEVAETLNLEKSTVSRWVQNLSVLESKGVSLPTLPCSSKGGRPAAISALQEKWIENDIAKKQRSNKSAKANTNEQLMPFLRAAQLTQAERGVAPMKVRLDPRTIASTQNRLGISKVAGERISKARVEAVDDPRNAICHAVVLECECKGRLPELMGNMDSTQFMGVSDGKNLKVLRARSNGLSCHSRTLSEDEMAFFVKYVSIYFTNGYASPPVFICASENIKEDEFIWNRIPLLSHSCDPESFGFLVWSKTRAGPIALWKKIFMDVVVPDIERLRSSCGLDPEHEDYLEQAKAIFFMDGDALQVFAAEDIEVTTKTTDSLVALLKHCASCSLIHQLCDLACIYRNSKQEVANIEVAEYGNQALDTHIRQSIVINNDRLKMASGQVDKCVRTLLKIVASLKNHVTPKNIISAARKAGMIGDPELWSEITRKIPFEACTHSFTLNEWTTIEHAWPNLVEEWEQQGYFCDRFLDQLGLPRGQYDEGVNKEDLTEIRWRTTQLNHHHIGPILVQRREAKRLAAADAETRRLETARVAATKAESAPLLQRIEEIWKEVSQLKTDIVEYAEKIKGIHIAAGRNYGRHGSLDLIRNLRESSARHAAAARTLMTSISASRNLATTSAKRGKVDEIQTELTSILGNREKIVKFISGVYNNLSKRWSSVKT